MPKCIFCMKDLGSCDQTTEHVFPESIGGSLKIRSVCGDCNSILGSRVDKTLTHYLLVQFKRFFEGIEGKTGKTPNPFGGVHTLAGTEQKVKLIGDTLKPYLLPYVGENIIILDSTDEQNLPNILNKYLCRHGRPNLSQEETQELFKKGCLRLNGLEISLRRERIVSPEISVSLKVSTYDFFIGIMKICYEMAFYWLDEEYLDDKTAAKIRQLFREFMCSEWKLNKISILDLFNKYEIRGQIEIGRLNMPGFANIDSNCHIALLAKVNHDIMCCIQIFDKLSGCVVVSEDSTRYKELDCGKFLQMNTTCKTLKETTFIEALQSLAK